MASLCRRALFQTCRRAFSNSTPRCADKQFPDPLELAQGLEKRQMLAELAGNKDPFHTVIERRGPGTKEEPHIVYSAFSTRLVGCVCEEDSCAIHWMWVHQGQPRRCSCGYWFKLVETDPV